MIMTFTVILVPQAFAQEFTKSTFFENVVVVYDLKLYKESGNFLMKKASGDVEVVIGLQSTSTDDFNFSDELIEKIQSENIVQSIVFTNMEEIDHDGYPVGCVPGVKGDEQCIMINLDFTEIKKFFTDEDKQQIDGRINRVHTETQRIGNSLIEQVNEELGINAKFHSVYIQTAMTEYSEEDDETQQLVSAVYISPKQTSYNLINNYTLLKSELDISIDFDFVFISGYYKIIPQEIINRPQYGIYCFQESPLPEGRGNAPIQWAILNNRKNQRLAIVKLRISLKNCSSYL